MANGGVLCVASTCFRAIKIGETMSSIGEVTSSIVEAMSLIEKRARRPKEQNEATNPTHRQCPHSNMQIRKGGISQGMKYNNGDFNFQT